MTAIVKTAATRALLHRLIELPALAITIQALPAATFAALIREVGLEDAGELVALATTAQLVQAFDEDLFVNARAGEREALDPQRFVTWLEVLLEAGEVAAADRVAELDEAFVAHALAGLVLVFEDDALRERLDDGDPDDARRVDKALESALSEELDGYLLIARQPDGWDAVLALILGLDRNHRALLVRILDRLAAAGRDRLDDLDELATTLTEGEALAEEVEAAREDRRSQQGHVEPQAARAFLTLAKGPLEREAARDPLTRAYFREFDRHATADASSTPADTALPPAIQRALASADGDVELIAPEAPTSAIGVFREALLRLRDDDAARFGARMEELAYLANVIAAGHARDGERLRPKAASDAAMATVCYGAMRASSEPTVDALVDVLRQRSCDVLFRAASHALATSGVKAGLLYAAAELDAAISAWRAG